MAPFAFAGAKIRTFSDTARISDRFFVGLRLFHFSTENTGQKKYLKINGKVS